jgi:hypothetical protein
VKWWNSIPLPARKRGASSDVHTVRVAARQLDRVVERADRAAERHLRVPEPGLEPLATAFTYGVT